MRRAGDPQDREHRAREVRVGGSAAAFRLLCLYSLCLAACAATPRYGDPDAVETVTIDFGSTDLHRIAEKMVASLLASPLVQEGAPPVFLVGRVANRTDEHIDTRAIADKIRTTLIQSGRVRFAADEVREEVLRELDYQATSGAVDPATRKRLGQLVGPGYLLTGRLTSIRKTAGRKTDLYFLFTLEVVDLESGLLRWSAQKEIRKAAKTPLVGW